MRAVNDFKDPVVENFDKELGFAWNFLGTPREVFAKVEDGCLRLKLLKNGMVPWEFDNTDGSVFSRIAKIGKTKENISFAGRRQQHLDFQATVTVHFSPEENETAGIVVLQNDANQLRLEIAKNQEGLPVVRCLRVVSHYDQEGIQHFSETVVGEIAAASHQTDYVLQVKGNGSRYSFYAGQSIEELASVADQVDGSFMGSETAGGFVGSLYRAICFRKRTNEREICSFRNLHLRRIRAKRRGTTAMMDIQTQKIEALIGEMTLEEKIGQLQQRGPSLVGAFEVSFEELLDMMFDGRISQEEFGKLMSTAEQDFHEEELRAGESRLLQWRRRCPDREPAPENRRRGNQIGGFRCCSATM